MLCSYIIARVLRILFRSDSSSFGLTSCSVLISIRPGIELEGGVGHLMAGKGMRDFGTEQDNLRGIVDPDQHDDNRGCSTVGRFQALSADVVSDRELPDLE